MSKAGRLGFVAGLIPQEKLNGFERLLFRCARGEGGLAACDLTVVVSLFQLLEHEGCGVA
jgi:hypothetical protein